MSIVKTMLVVSSLAFFMLGAREMHVQERPCHNFAAAKVAATYPPIESPLQNTVAGAAKAALTITGKGM